MIEWIRLCNIVTVVNKCFTLLTNKKLEMTFKIVIVKANDDIAIQGNF